MTEQYPLDFEALKKDSWIDTPELERATGVFSIHKDFSLRVTALAALIRERVGIESRQDGLRLRLMTDQEASAYLHRQQRLAIRRSIGLAGRMTEVNTEHMSQDELRAHDARQRSMQSNAMAMLAERRRQRALAASTPALQLNGAKPADV